MRKLLRSLLLPLALTIISTTLIAQKPAQLAIHPGKERWAIKTSVPEGANLQKPKGVKFTELLQLGEPPGVKKDDARYQNDRIPAFPNSLDVKEGDILTTKGWLHLVAAEDDGDYHIQISDSPTSGDHCLIVEVPNPDPAFVSSSDLRPLSQASRQLIKSRMLRNQEPSSRGSVMAHPPFVKITGQLFYDDSHVGDPPRGKKKMHAATLWELHPVTQISFAPKPH